MVTADQGTVTSAYWIILNNSYQTLIKFLYEVPRQHDQALTSVESDDHLEMENLIEEEILQMVSEGPLNSRILKMVDEKLR